MAVEPRLQLMAQNHPDLDVIRVEDSTSKAQNVNAALRVAEGEFVGIFDADHHPMDGAFDRAWRWLADGADVVQGHCVIRNGSDSWLTRLVAVEFEQIYAVAHPGRAGLHDFGIFGGSNGYWRAVRAGAGPPARLVPHRGHRGLDARAAGRWPDRQRPGPGQPRAGARLPARPCGASGCAGRRAGSRSPAGTSARR